MFEVLLEIAGIQAILFGLYYLFLRKETDFFWRRSYLIGLVLISGTMPFIHLPAPELVQSVNQTVFSAPVLPSASISATETAGFDWFVVLWGLSILGSMVVLLTMAASLLEIYKLYRTGTPFSLGSFWIWLHPKVESSFSFFNWIFSKEVHASIIAHEAAHVQLKHSYDVILFQLNRAIFWWNPVSWLLLKELTQVHEYQADQLAIKDKNIDEYQELLINTTLSSMGWGLASSFHSGSLLKRLHAMKQKTKKINRWKISSLGALVAIIALVFACEELDKDIKKMSEDSRQIAFEELPAELQADLAERQDQFTYLITYVENSATQSVKEKLNQLEGIDPKLIEKINVNKTDEGGELYIVLRKDAESYNYVKKTSKTEGDVFTLVEKMPEFTGGMNGFYKYIGQNLTYPKQARQMGVEGTVFVQFVVDKTGQVTRSEVVRGIGASCDSVAREVVVRAPKFTPGTQDGEPVDVQMVIPINFKLNNISKKQTLEKVEVQAVDKKFEEEILPRVKLTEYNNTAAKLDGMEKSERTAVSGTQMVKVAKSLSEVTVVGLSENASGVSNIPPPPPVQSIMPEYKGGMEALYKFVGSNIKYPKQAKNEGIQGKVFVQFIVKKDGSVDQVKVVKGIGAGCDAEASRVVKLLDQWTPGTKEGHPVDMHITLPIKFAL